MSHLGFLIQCDANGHVSYTHREKKRKKKVASQTVTSQ